MKTPQKIIQQCSEKREELSVNEVIEKVDKIIRYIKSKDYETLMKTGRLAKIAWNLSVIMFNLGEMVTEYTTLANASYIYRKFKYYEEYRKLREEVDDITVADSEKQAQEKISEYFESQLESRYLADLLKTKYDECNRMVMVLQSIMKKEKEEYNRSDEIRK